MNQKAHHIEKYLLCKSKQNFFNQLAKHKPQIAYLIEITHMHIQNNKSIIVILYNKNKEHTRVNENQNIQR